MNKQADFADRYQLAFQLYPYARSVDQDADEATRHPIIIVGGGPIGLALALDLGLKGTPALLLDDHEGPGAGSKAICFAKRTLEICDRLGAGEAMVDKGVVWNLGRVFQDESEIYNFNLLPESGHKRPAFINLQQPYFEKFLTERIRQAQADGAPIDIRGRNRVTAISPQDDHVTVEIDTPDGPYTLQADWLIAADGANSPIRDMLGLGFEGRIFEDNFLIADIRAHADFPTERRFWFDPPFNRGQTALMHKQPDDVWRLDFQLGWDIDRKAELDPDKIRTRVAAMIGPETDFDLVWSSIYTFRCATMKDYIHGRVIFAGDSAHQVSPFGARGANGGMQDADNLGWKLALVTSGKAPDSLIQTYQTERKAAALENIQASSRTADFLTPRSYADALFRDATLALAKTHAFARPMVNSGRLSQPATYATSPLNGEDALPGGPSATRPGAPCPDAPLGNGYLLDRLGGAFTLLAIGTDAPATDLATLEIDTPSPDLRDRYLGTAKSALYLIRPDQHIAARWARHDPQRLATALSNAMGEN